jgi:hypothetical protein
MLAGREAAITMQVLQCYIGQQGCDLFYKVLPVRRTAHDREKTVSPSPWVPTSEDGTWELVRSAHHLQVTWNLYPQ